MIAMLNLVYQWLAGAYSRTGVTINGVAPALIQETTMLPGNNEELAKSECSVPRTPSRPLTFPQKSQSDVLASPMKSLRLSCGWLKLDMLQTRSSQLTVECLSSDRMLPEICLSMPLKGFMCQRLVCIYDGPESRIE